MSKKVEIEERALLNREDRDRVLEYMGYLDPIEEVNRVVVHYDTPDDIVELRCENDALSIVRKHTNKRGRTIEETEELEGSLLTNLKDMARSGYTHAKISLRRKHEVTHKNLIYSLRDVVYYRNPKKAAPLSLFELEQDIFDGHDERSRVRIHQAMRKLDIQPLEQDEFWDWVDQTYKDVDGDFEYSDGNALALVMKLQRAGFIV